MAELDFFFDEDLLALAVFFDAAPLEAAFLPEGFRAAVFFDVASAAASSTRGLLALAAPFFEVADFFVVVVLRLAVVFVVFFSVFSWVSAT